MLHRIEEDHPHSRPARVSNHFDLVCGSGLGGILAIMCGILHMTGDELVEEFVTLCRAVFPPHLDITQRTMKLEEEMKRIVAKFSEGRESRRMFSEDQNCKTFVCAAPAHNTSHPRLFRNYRSRLNASLDCMIWEAARAITAMPDFFLPITIGPEHIGELFVSGELGWNNPTDELTEEASLAFKNRHVACIINVGSGHLGHLSLSNGLSNLFLRIALDCERVAERMERRFTNVPGVYRRLSVEQGMQNLDVDLTNLHVVVSHAKSYLQGSPIARSVDRLLDDLIQRPERFLVAMISGAVPHITEVLRPKRCPPPTPFFTGRRAELQIMEEYFKLDRNSCRVVVLYGIGGGGKTQIVLEFIQRNKDRFTEIFFVDASNKVTLENQLKAIAGGSSENPSIEDALRLLQTRREDWLLFFDNADDPAVNLRPYIAFSHGNILITTRNREVRDHAPDCSLWVDRLELEDAKELLLRGVPVVKNPETQEAVVKIVHELGCLALAVNHARAFLAKGLCTLHEYLPLYVRNRKRLLEEKSTQSTDDYEHTIYTTWVVSFDKLSSKAALLFELLSYMHHDTIPCRLFEIAWNAFGKEDKEALPQTLVPFLSSFKAVDSTWDLFYFRTLVGELLSFSLVEYNATDDAMSLHPLVQQWARTHWQHPSEVVNATQTLLALATPDGESSQDHGMRLSLLSHIRESAKNGNYQFLYRAGAVYRDGGMFQESLDIRRMALSDSQRRLGSGHPDTLPDIANLALAYLDVGIYSEALKLNKEALEIAKPTLGHDHPHTVIIMTNLAVVYLQLGQYRDAVSLNEEVLGLRRRLLGNDHPDTLASMNNLATVYSQVGQYSDARSLNTEALELMKRVLGNDHPSTLMSMNNLARICSLLGQHKDALKLNEEVLELRRQISGGEHPDTLMSLSNIALTYSHLGQYRDALDLSEVVIGLRKRVLGDYHPDTLASMINLAWIYSELGQYHDALSLNKEVLELLKSTLGKDHPTTLANMSNLASMHFRLGQHTEALTLNAEALELRTRALGDEHPDTLASMNNLATTYLVLKQPRDALKLIEEVLEMSKRVLGDEHPDTLRSMNNLALIWSQLGEKRDALKLSEEVLELRKRVQGDEHPDTLGSIHMLSTIHSQLGQHHDAFKLSEQVFEMRKRILGDEHPDTLASMDNLAFVHSDLGHHRSALEVHERAHQLRSRIRGPNHPDTINDAKWIEHLRAKIETEPQSQSLTDRLQNFFTIPWK
ncbi:hypothetical protein DL96DRAFT_1715740 [Flagelloscypha sp. PMI_526]|nr:hypothetical protein DL96DRAFT_1715740 [Flagelloscypha sp. PMI_526]